MMSSMWAAGKWMAANQSIKQEKTSGAMMAEETPATTTTNTSGSPITSPVYPTSFPDNLPFSNYDGTAGTNMSSMSSNAYATSLNSSSGEVLVE